MQTARMVQFLKVQCKDVKWNAIFQCNWGRIGLHKRRGRPAGRLPP